MLLARKNSESTNRDPYCLFVVLSFATFTEAVLHAQASQPLPPATQGVGADQSNDLSVTVGKSALVDFSKPCCACRDRQRGRCRSDSRQPIHEVMVNGKVVGNTSLIVWEQGGERQFFNVTVHPQPCRGGREHQLASSRTQGSDAGTNITAVSENNLVFLRGTVNDLASSDRAVQMASSAGKVVNLLYVNVPPPPPQILLKVRFASVDRNASKQLGINIFSTGAANTIGTVTTGQFSPPSVSSPTVHHSNYIGCAEHLPLPPGYQPGRRHQAMEQQGLAGVLLNPTSSPGGWQTGELSRWRRISLPYRTGDPGESGELSITFKNMAFNELYPNHNSSRNYPPPVAPEVSALDFTNAVTISGFTEPAITFAE